jgi:hypothetical protein
VTGHESREGIPEIVSLARGPKGEQGDRGEGMTRGARRAAAYLAVLLLVIGAASLLFTVREIGQLRAAVLSECAFAADLAGAPVSVAPATGKAAKLGVSIVADSRVQWRGLGCPGRLAPPAPSFVRWARYYHLPSS